MKATAALLIISIYTLILLSSAKTTIPDVNASGTTDYPWTMFRHDSLRTGVTSASGPLAQALAWSHSTGGQVWASPAVSDGLVFSPSSDGTLYVIDEYTGQLKWSYTTGVSIIASPVVAGGTVYFATRSPGIVYALNEQTGGQIWTYTKPGYAITSSLAVADGRLFFGNWCQGGLCNPAGYFVSLNATTGLNIWPAAATPSASIVSSPSIHNGHVFFGEDDGTIVSLDESTGATVWSTVPSGSNFVRSSPTVMSGRIYVGTGNNFVALDETSGATIWTFNTGNSNATSAAAYNGRVYFGTGRGRVYALNATNAAILWTSARISAGFSSSPALSLGSGTLYLGANDDNLYALNMATGSVIWTYLTGAPIFSSPAVADGRVFFGSFDNNIYSLGARPQQLQVSVSANPTTVVSSSNTILTIAVANGTNPVSGAAIILSSSSGGAFTPVTVAGPGAYTANFTAPVVTGQLSIVLTVQAAKNGYQDGFGQTNVTVTPFPPLNVVITPSPSTVSPGGDVTLQITVSNNTQGITGANITLSSSGGGSFSTPSDQNNGNYIVIFNAPLDYSQPTITVVAAKAGFSLGQKQVTLTVSGAPNIISGKIAGVPVLLIFLGVLALILVLTLVMVAAAKRNKSAGYYIESSKA